jgi:hypothetical protein
MRQKRRIYSLKAFLVSKNLKSTRQQDVETCTGAGMQKYVRLAGTSPERLWELKTSLSFWYRL